MTHYRTYHKKKEKRPSILIQTSINEPSFINTL